MVDYGCAIAPGNQGAYIMNVDVFAFPKNSKPEVLAAQKKLAEVMMDPATQAQFNLFKGALPARLDANISALDVCAQAGKQIIDGGPANQMPNTALAFSSDVDGQITDLITSYFNSTTMTAEAATAAFAKIIANADK